MDTEDFRGAYEKLLKTAGIDYQLGLMQEEAAELIAAINRFRFSRRKRNMLQLTADVIEEVADVLVMVEQLIVIFGHDEVKRVRDEKVKRTLERVYGKDF